MYTGLSCTEYLSGDEQLVDDLELLAVRANATMNGLRVLESPSANKGKTQFVKLFLIGEREGSVFRDFTEHWPNCDPR